MTNGFMPEQNAEEPAKAPEMPATHPEPETGREPQFPPNETYRDYTIDPPNRVKIPVPEIKQS